MNGEDADVPTGPFVGPSSQLLFRYEITNTGNTVLNNVTFTDDKLGLIVSCPRNTLAVLPDPLARMTCTATGPAPSAGQYTNVATVSGTSPNDVTVNDDNPANAFAAVPHVDIVKFVNGQDADLATGPFVAPGSTLQFRYVVTNDGNVPLTNVSVTDLINAGGVGGVLVTCPKTTLAVNEVMTCTGSGPAPAAGQYTNTGTVVGTGPTMTGQQGQVLPGVQVTDNNPANAFVAAPAVGIVKFVNTLDADSAPGETVPAGSTLTFRYQVTNTGNVTLTNVTVTDQIIVGGSGVVAVTCPKNVLTPGEVMNCSGTGTAPLSGQYTNVGTVVGTGPNTTGPTGTPVPGTTVTANNPANVTVTPQITGTPGILIIKRVNGFDANDAPGVTVAVGSTLNFTYEVYNTGNVVLTNVKVTDQVIVGGASNVVVTCPSSTLAVSAVPMICTGPPRRRPPASTPTSARSRAPRRQVLRSPMTTRPTPSWPPPGSRSSSTSTAPTPTTHRVCRSRPATPSPGPIR